MLKLFVVVVHLALLAAAGSHPRRRNAAKSVQFSKRGTLTDDISPYTTQLSALSIRDIARPPAVAKRAGIFRKLTKSRPHKHDEPSAHPPMVSVPLRYARINDEHTLVDALTVQISIGDTIREEFDVLVDTCSVDLWVFSSECKDPNYASKRKYVPKEVPPEEKAQTKKPEIFKERYGSCTVEGTVHPDVVALGGVSLNDQYFAAVTSISRTTFPHDGILGLSPVATSPDPFSIHHPNFLHHAIQDRKIAPIFAIHPGEPHPMLHLGGVDPAYANSLKYYKVMKKEWKLIKDGRLSVQIPGADPVQYVVRQPVFDMGGGSIYGPRRIVGKIYKTLKGRKIQEDGIDTWTFRCGTRPKISVNWGDGPLPIQRFNLSPDRADNEDCIGAIQESGHDDWSFGRPYMLDVYSAYDIEGKRIAFTALGHQPEHP